MSLSLCRISVSVLLSQLFHHCNIRYSKRQFGRFNKAAKPLDRIRSAVGSRVLLVGAGETANTGTMNTFRHEKRQSRPHPGETRPAECGFFLRRCFSTCQNRVRALLRYGCTPACGRQAGNGLSSRQQTAVAGARLEPSQEAQRGKFVLTRTWVRSPPHLPKKNHFPSTKSDRGRCENAPGRTQTESPDTLRGNVMQVFH